MCGGDVGLLHSAPSTVLHPQCSICCSFGGSTPPPQKADFLTVPNVRRKPPSSENVGGLFVAISLFQFYCFTETHGNV